jgi:adenosine receptor A2b
LQNKNRQEIVSNATELLKQRKEVRAAKTLAMIVGTFLIAWMPAVLEVIIVSLTEDRQHSNGLVVMSAVLLHLNTAADPLIYAYRMKNIREAIKRVFQMKTNQIKSEIRQMNGENL